MNGLEQLTIIWISVLISVFLGKKTRLTPVLWYLAAGALLVNLKVLPHESDEFIRGFAEIGIILIMFALGFEENTNTFLRSIKRSWGIALFGALGPFICAYSITLYFWGQQDVAIMCGLAMTATAVSLTMVSLKSEGLQRSPAATGIMTSAVLDDIASLAAIAIVVPIAVGDGPTSAIDIMLIVFKAIAFFFIITILGAWVLPHARKGPASLFPGLRKILGFADGEHATLTILIIALLVAILAHILGFHPAVGAYLSGLILRKEYFPESATDSDIKDSYENTKSVLDNVAFSWIGPVFFVELGTKLVLDWTLVVTVIPHMLILTLALITIQISSAGLAAHYTGHFSKPDSLLIGLGMLGRAELAFVVLDIAYVQNSIIGEDVFFTLMFTAFWLNVAVPVSIALWKRKFGNR